MRVENLIILFGITFQRQVGNVLTTHETAVYDVSCAHVTLFALMLLGGTTMRAILYNFARDNNYNMSSNYGAANIQKIPFSHNKGSSPNFIYGHVRDQFVHYATQSERSCLMKNSNDKSTHKQKKTLYIFMIREPTSWIFSRYLHHNYHYNLGLAKEIFQNISEFSMTYAPEYLEFLDEESRDFSLKWFRESMNVADGGAVPIPKGGHLIEMSPFQSPADIGNNFENKLLRCRNSIVLIQEYFVESLELLNHAFGTKAFTESLPRGRRFNKLDDKHISQLTSLDINSLHRVMQVHHVIYHACLKHFFESYYSL